MLKIIIFNLITKSVGIQHDISVQLIGSTVIKATKYTQIEKYKYPEKL